MCASDPHRVGPLYTQVPHVPRIVLLYMHCVPIGPYDWSFVCIFCPCILNQILCVPLDWSFVLAYTLHRLSITVYVYMHVAKNNTIFTTTCLYALT